MPALLIHGNPDTSHLWDRVREHLGPYGDEVVAADLPGFAEPPPAGFGCTKQRGLDRFADAASLFGQAPRLDQIEAGGDQRLFRSPARGFGIAGDLAGFGFTGAVGLECGQHG